MNDDLAFARIRSVGGDRYRAFLDAGYREHYSNSGAHSTPFLLQKCIRGGDGTKLYFVNVFAYDFSEYKSVPGPFAIHAEVQYNTYARDESRTFDVSYHDRPDDTPETIEAFFRRVYDAMGCEPYGD